MAKAKAKAKPKATKAKPKAKAKAKPKAKAKAKPKAKTKPKAKARPKAKAKAKPAPRSPKKATSKPTPAASPASSTNGASGGSGSIAPFQLAETSPGKFSLLLTVFDPASKVFESAGLEGGGYSWESIANHVGEVIAPELADRYALDPEGSMFCAYGEDRAALERLGFELARFFNDTSALAGVIQQIGRENFED